MGNFYSSPLLNKVEKVSIAGKDKTAFYTEVNTNISVGSRVFIVNGNYDSNNYIKQNRYNRFVDGWRVLSVNKNKIVLDIDWTGQDVFSEDLENNYIKVWAISTEKEVNYLDSIQIDSYTYSVSKFEFGLTNNILFSNENISSLGLTAGNFYAKLGLTYSNINSFVNSEFTGYFLPDYTNSGFSNNGKIKVKNSGFTYSNTFYQKDKIYEFNNSILEFDVKSNPSYLSKLNFRDGIFLTEHNDGIFGTSLKRLNFGGTKWNSGIFLNSNWTSGILFSKSGQNEKTTYSILANDQVLTFENSNNNSGFGFNYFIDSNFESGEIRSGNFINSTIGDKFGNTFSSIDFYYGVTSSFDVIASNSKFDFSTIYNTKIDNSKVQNSKLFRSLIESSDVVDNELNQTVVYSSNLSSEDSIVISAADIWGYLPGSSASDLSSATGVLKLYLDENYLERLNLFDSFYLPEINRTLVQSLLTDGQKVNLPYETKWVLDKFINQDFLNDEILVSTKTSDENKWKSIVALDNSVYYRWSYLNDIVDLNGKNFASIDIDLGNYLAHNYYSINQIVDLNLFVGPGSVVIDSTLSVPVITDKDIKVDFEVVLTELDTSTYSLIDSVVIKAGSSSATSSVVYDSGDFGNLDTSTYSVSFNFNSSSRNNYTLRVNPLEFYTTTTTTTSTTTLFYSYYLASVCGEPDTVVTVRVLGTLDNPVYGTNGFYFEEGDIYVYLTGETTGPDFTEGYDFTPEDLMEDACEFINTTTTTTTTTSTTTAPPATSTTTTTTITTSTTTLCPGCSTYEVENSGVTSSITVIFQACNGESDAIVLGPGLTASVCSCITPDCQPPLNPHFSVIFITTGCGSTSEI